jgi:hypothetical protein
MIEMLDPVAMEQGVLIPVVHRVRLQVMLSIFKGGEHVADFTAATHS